MLGRSAILYTALVATAVAQESSGWRKFGTSSGDQAYSVSQSAPAQSVQAPAAAVSVPADLTLPAGTFLKVRINEKLSSDKNQPGDFFTATLTQPLVANGLVIAQPGQDIAGRVAEAVRAKDGNGTSRLGLELTEISLADGQQVAIRTQLMEYQRGKSNGRDGGVVVATTAAGAAIGAAAGGGLGAAAGAVGGAAAGMIGVMVNRSRATEIHPEAILTFRTIDTVNVATDRSGGAFQPVRQQDYRPQLQPRQRTVAPPAYYGGYYGGFYDPFYYPYYYGPGFGTSFFFYSRPRVVVRGGGVYRGAGRRR